MNWLKNVWNWICGTARTILDAVMDAVVAKAKALAADKDLAGLALDAVRAAAKQGLTGDAAWVEARNRFLTGDAAWVEARNRFVTALKEAGRELGDTAIDTILQNIYAGWKELGKPEA